MSRVQKRQTKKNDKKHTESILRLGASGPSNKSKVICSTVFDLHGRSWPDDVDDYQSDNDRKSTPKK